MAGTSAKLSNAVEVAKDSAFAAIEAESCLSESNAGSRIWFGRPQAGRALLS